MRCRGPFLALVMLTLIAGYVAGCATGSGQPHMKAAVDELLAARHELNAANSDKGGHRIRATELVNAALDEVRAGMDYARTR